MTTVSLPNTKHISFRLQFLKKQKYTHPMRHARSHRIPSMEAKNIAHAVNDAEASRPTHTYTPAANVQGTPADGIRSARRHIVRLCRFCTGPTRLRTFGVAHKISPGILLRAHSMCTCAKGYELGNGMRDEGALCARCIIIMSFCRK